CSSVRRTDGYDIPRLLLSVRNECKAEDRERVSPLRDPQGRRLSCRPATAVGNPRVHRPCSSCGRLRFATPWATPCSAAELSRSALNSKSTEYPSQPCIPVSGERPVRRLSFAIGGCR